MKILKPYAPILLSVLRFVAGLMLLAHGVAKYLNFPAGPMNNASPMTLPGFAGILELVGGACLVLGLFTRPAAFILSGMAAVAYFMVHYPKSFFPAATGGEAAILFCFVLLYIFAAGGGAWSLDRVLLKSDD